MCTLHIIDSRDWPEIDDNTEEIDGRSEIKPSEEQPTDGAVDNCTEIEVAKAEIARKTGIFILIGFGKKSL